MAADHLVARLERSAALACAAISIAVVLPWGWRMSAAVLAGGILIGTSFLLIKTSVFDLTAFADGPRDPSRRPNIPFAVVKLTGRYALLAFLAYVMIARLRLHPVGLVVGASSVLVAAILEAGRLFRKTR